MSRAVLSRRALVASLAAIAVLAAAPFVIATALSERRLDSARADVMRIAGALRGSSRVGDVRVLIGRGTAPRFRGEEWPDQKADLHDVSPDPWLNAYLVNVGASSSIWVLSAGPNGIVETPFDGATAAQGDDVAARIR